MNSGESPTGAKSGRKSALFPAKRRHWPLVTMVLAGMIGGGWAVAKNEGDGSSESRPLAATALPKGALVRLGKVGSANAGEVKALAFSPEGKILASGSADGTISLWEVAKGQEIHKLVGHKQFVSSVAFSPDGRTLASGSADKTVRLWDVATAREQRALQGHRARVDAVTFSPNGQTLATTGDGAIRLWDPASGRHLQTFLGHGAWGNSLSFSADGKTLSSLGMGRAIHVWDTTTGKELRHLTTREDCTTHVFSPNGKMAILEDAEHALRLWEVDSATEIRRFPAHADWVVALAFSPDGKMLARADWKDQAVYLAEVATGMEFAKLDGHADLITCLAFSPDGRTLTSGSLDRTALIWDLGSPEKKALAKPVNLKAADLDKLWADLANANAAVGYPALWTFVEAPEQSVAFLKNHLQPTSDQDWKRIQQLIKDLDNKDFRVREKASRQLQGLGQDAEPALRQALLGKTSLEVRRRIDDLLRGPGLIYQQQTLRQLRAVQVLEQIGSPEARQLLKSLAEGARFARQTVDAQEALERLERRPLGGKY